MDLTKRDYDSNLEWPSTDAKSPSALLMWCYRSSYVMHTMRVYIYQLKLWTQSKTESTIWAWITWHFKLLLSVMTLRPTNHRQLTQCFLEQIILFEFFTCKINIQYEQVTFYARLTSFHVETTETDDCFKILTNSSNVCPIRIMGTSHIIIFI